MNVKAILLAVSLIGASTGAYASPTVTPVPGSENYTFSHYELITSADGSFNDWISFTINGDREFSASLSGTSTGSISFSAFNLYASYDAESGTAGSVLATGNIAAFNPKISFAGLDENLSGPATYWINIAGTYSGNANYTGTIAAAVPEPSTYGMLALGLGLIGFAARGRSKFSA